MDNIPEHIVDTPIGTLALAAHGGGLVEIRWPHVGTRAISTRSNRGQRVAGTPIPPEAGVPMPSARARSNDVLDEAAGQLGEYFAGRRRRFDLPLTPSGTPFQLAVWRAVAAIPYGETRSYGELARELGRPTAARAVGRAVGLNPLPIVVPCHRVVGSGGQLTGYAGGLPAKARLLALESKVPPEDLVAVTPVSPPRLPDPEHMSSRPRIYLTPST